VTGIPLCIVDKPPAGDCEPGMCWRYASGDVPGRECWWIVLPNTKPQDPGYCTEVSWRTTDRASDPPHGMWDVTGTMPLITVSPSIDVECWVVRDGQTVREGSYWHGWIRSGVLESA
jgi:hypothetical protein